MPALVIRASVTSVRSAPCDTQSGCLNLFLPAVSNLLLPAALAFFLVGCAHLEPDAPVRTSLLAPPEPRLAPQPISAPKQAEAPAKSAPPAAQQAPRAAEIKSPPVTAAKGSERLVAPASKGAEKLVAPSAPTPVRASEVAAAPAEPAEAKPPTTPDPGTVAPAPIQELILKGPPPQIRPRRTGMILMVCLGLGLVGTGVFVVTRLGATRRVKSAGPQAADKDDLKMPPELLFKEPMTLPQETAAVEES